MARRRINQDRPEASDDEFEAFLADVRGSVWASQKGGGTWDKTAADAKLSAGTVANFASGKTGSPHLRTVFRLLRACDRRFANLPSSTETLPEEFVMTSRQRAALKRRLANK